MLTGNWICAIPRFDNSILSAGELVGDAGIEPVTCSV
jgi:hypothetical protein